MIRRSALATLALGALLSLSACGHDSAAAPSWEPSRAPQAQGRLGHGFWDPADPPVPEGTITPAAGSWDDVRPKPGYRVALLVDGVTSRSSLQTEVLRAAVEAWGASVEAKVTDFVATRPHDYVATIQKALDAKPDLVISVGNGMTDPVAMVSAPNLETPFLIVGAQVAEPTANVTAADWIGAMYRGEGLGLPAQYDPKTFTPERAGRAVRAGVAAVLTGLTGIVVEVA